MITETIDVLTIWDKCLNYLRDELPSQKFNTWLRPLQADMNKNTLTLLAPNQFVLDWVNEHFLVKITETLRELCEGEPPVVKLKIGSKAAEVVRESVKHEQNAVSSSHAHTSS